MCGEVNYRYSCKADYMYRYRYPCRLVLPSCPENQRCELLAKERNQRFEGVYRCLSSFLGSVAVYLRGACRGVVGGEKSKISENFRNFRKVVKWSEMHRKVI